MRAAPPVALNPRERAELLRWSRGRSVPVRQVDSARIVLLAAEGRTNKQIGKLLRLSPVTVRRWRARFALLGLAGISGDAPRSGHRSGPGAPTAAVILERTRSTRPTNGVRWTTRTLGRSLGVSHTTVGKVWRSSGVRPPRYRHWRLSPDVGFSNRRVDVAGIYVDPPGTVLALSIGPPGGSLGRSPGPPLRRTTGKGESLPIERRAPGTSEQLVEAIGLLDGLPPSAESWRLTSRELLLFLESLDERSPRLSEIHLLTGARSLSRDDRVLRWIDRHPRFHLVPPGIDRPISTVVREWFQPPRSSRPNSAELLHLPQLERWLRSYLDGVVLLGRPFVWTQNGAVSHWRGPPTDTFSVSNADSARISTRSRSPS